MSLAESIESLRNFDLNDLDLNNIGSWPAAVKVIICSLFFLLVVGGGYYFHLSDLQNSLDATKAQEESLKQQFSTKAFQAANLEAYKEQMAEMELSFGALLRQLPSDTEVPGLLEDITHKGAINGVSIDRIDLLDEQAQTFYIELPIAIEAEGSYHELGAFVSGMAGLPRIVTLHDFQITAKEVRAPMLKLSILAKTYRYRELDEQL